MEKTFKLYLFGALIYKSKDLLIIQTMKNTYKKELQKFLIIK
jgi:hypothetical protein